MKRLGLKKVGMGDRKPYFRNVAGYIRLPAFNSRPVPRFIFLGHKNQQVPVEFFISMIPNEGAGVHEDTRYIHDLLIAEHAHKRTRLLAYVLDDLGDFVPLFGTVGLGYGRCPCRLRGRRP